MGCKTVVSEKLMEIAGQFWSLLRSRGREQKNVVGNYFRDSIIVGHGRSPFDALEDDLARVIKEFSEKELKARFDQLKMPAVTRWKEQKPKSGWPVLTKEKRSGLTLPRNPCNNAKINLVDPIFRPLYSPAVDFQVLIDKVDECLRRCMDTILVDMQELLRKNYQRDGVHATTLTQIIEEFIKVRADILCVYVCVCVREREREKSRQSR